MRDTTASDIVSTRVVNGPNRLLVTLTYRNLRAGGLQVYVDNRPGLAGPELALVTGVRMETDWMVAHVRDWRVVGQGPIHACNSDVSWTRSTVTVSLARGCPRGVGAVKVAAVAKAEGHHRYDWAPGFHKLGSAVPKS